MTVIAAIENDGFPMLIADMLVSDRTEYVSMGMLVPQIPTVGMVDRFDNLNAGMRACGLVQKICVIADNCAVALAGLLCDAESMVTS